MTDPFADDKQRANDILNAARAQTESMAQLALNAVRKPYSDLFAFYDRLLNEPAPPVKEWPARAAAASLAYSYGALEYQIATARSFLKALETAFPAAPDTIQIDPHSETEGPIVLRPSVPVDSANQLVRPNLVCVGIGVIPARHVEITVQDRTIAFRVVGLRPEAPQPLPLGLYTGELRRKDGHHVALLKVQVVANVP